MGVGVGERGRLVRRWLRGKDPDAFLGLGKAAANGSGRSPACAGEREQESDWRRGGYADDAAVDQLTCGHRQC